MSLLSSKRVETLLTRVHFRLELDPRNSLCVDGDWSFFQSSNQDFLQGVLSDLFHAGLHFHLLIYLYLVGHHDSPEVPVPVSKYGRSCHEWGPNLPC